MERIRDTGIESTSAEVHLVAPLGICHSIEKSHRAMFSIYIYINCTK